MNLRNIYLKSKNNIVNIEDIEVSKLTPIVDSDNLKDSKVFMDNIKYTDSIVKSLNNIMSIPFLKKEAAELHELVLECMRYPIREDNGKKIQNLRDILYSKMKSTIDLYESMGYKDVEGIEIDIKLPSCNNITDFKNYINDIEFIFTKCPFLQHERESIRFDSVDVGSTWLLLIIVGVGATCVLANNLAALIDKSLIIKSHRITVEEQEQAQLEHLRKKQVKQEVLDVIIEYYKLMKKECINNSISEIEGQSGITLKDGEERGRVEQTFAKMESLIDKGLQIYTAIDSPEEVKVLFPPIETMSISEEVKDLIEQIKD